MSAEIRWWHSITEVILSFSNSISGPFYKDAKFIKVRKKRPAKELDKAKSITEHGLESDPNDGEWYSYD